MLKRLERKLGRYAIPGLTLFLVTGQGAAWIMSKAKPEVLEAMTLSPRMILEGEVWRLFSFIFVPPLGTPFFGIQVTGDIFTIFGLLILFSFGRALDAYWGNFRYNLFILLGWFIPLVVAFSLFTEDLGGVGLVSINLMVFQAFAYLNPEYEILLMLILPVKIKWLARLTWLFLGLGFLMAVFLSVVSLDPTPVLVSLAAVANFFVFFTSDILLRLRGVGRRAAKTKEVRAKASAVTHRCSACGITDRDDPQMSFRYCSQCAGRHAYCQDHLRDHEHVRE